MDRDLSQFVPQNGMNVIGADGEKVGDIDGVERDYFIVRKGFFFPQDHYIPMTAISSYDEDQVYLNVTKDEALEQEWTNPPTGTGYDSSEAAPLPDDQAGMPAAGLDYGRTDDTLAGIDTDRTDDVDTRLDRNATLDRDVNLDQDRETIDVHQEELVANKRDVQRGEVQINKNVVEEQQTLEVPVTEEEVEVTRRRVNRDATADDHAFEEGTIEIPLRGEEVDVEKRSRVVEEIDVDKTARTHNEQVTDTVRREEVNIEGENVDLANSTDSDLRRKANKNLP